MAVKKCSIEAIHVTSQPGRLIAWVAKAGADPGGGGLGGRSPLPVEMTPSGAKDLQAPKAPEDPWLRNSGVLEITMSPLST